jgi:hypothetical protein
LNTYNPKIRNARKPITAIRKFRTVTIRPLRPITPSNIVTQPNTTNNNQMAPVKNPRKIPKIP